MAQPVQTDELHPRWRGQDLVEETGRAAGDHRDAGKPGGQLGQQLRHPRPRARGYRVLHDGGQGAVEVEAQRRVGGVPGEGEQDLRQRTHDGCGIRYRPERPDRPR